MSEKPTKGFDGEIVVVTEIVNNLGTIYAMRKKLLFKGGVLAKESNAPKQEICKAPQRR